MSDPVADSVQQEILARIDRGRLVKTVIEAVSISSPTGDELEIAEWMRDTLEALDLDVRLQEVEEGRANVLGTWAGAGGGPTLMFNGHMDTSYSGAEPWLRGIPGFRPEGFEEDGYIYGLGVANMKGALCCYLEALRALQDAGVRLRGDLLIAAVAGEIEKTQYGDEFRGRLYRGYSAGSRHLVQHGGVADICILGEPTEHKIVLAHFGAMWARISTHGPFIHTAFSRERQQENSIRRMQDVIAAVDRFIPEWEAEMQHEGVPAMANIGAVQGGMAWRASRTPRQTDLFLDLRVPPRVPMATARRRFLDFVRELAERHPEHDIDGEVYLTAPGAEVGEGDVVVAAVDAAHKVVNGREPERDIVHWYSDASALTRYGIQTVNYGTASGLPSAEKGENVEIDGLINVTKVYALAAAQLCGVDR